MARRDLARFLRERRDSLRPTDVGLPSGTGLRRTPGLRREEVAGLANMSVDYLVRLEQGRGPSPSPRILDGLTRALRLDAAERRHLFGLAGSDPTPPAGPSRHVRPYVRDLLHRMPEAAAVVTDASYDVIAWSPLAEALLGGLGARPNLARRRFSGTERPVSSGHEEFGEIAVARLRAARVRYPHDERLAALVSDLSTGSEEFRRIWATDPVRSPGHRTKTLEHPRAGTLRLNCDVLAVPDDDQQVVFVTADPGSPSARALRALSDRAPGSDGPDLWSRPS
ncbi:helix-turn-helix domain-containing protein [Actinoplanes sp. LDG1-06]|uniref:Helix-turn-helix domain-containing protein n=1 Tax=Paractinoplanes ovalisporus TaxID=2810368 RepID=A0ABS2ANS9_9ACTN|nr:helix-turn-helix transcriptional regulator [Actinoplanes ovalisporus]MBM2621491.1 helix-turn-helix domain-containing protein [Actinoplanes ovalisporus]